jgi:hypothetical protein
MGNASYCAMDTDPAVRRERRRKMRFGRIGEAWDRFRRWFVRNGELILLLIRIAIVILRAIGLLSRRMRVATRGGLGVLPRATVRVRGTSSRVGSTRAARPRDPSRRS